MLTLATVHDRLVEAISQVRGPAVDPVGVRGLPLEEPQAVEAGLAGLLPGRTLLAGTVERRLLVAEQPELSGWTVANLCGESLESWPWPTWTNGRVQLDRPGSWLSTATIADDGVSRLLRPRVLLVALYHPEHFPLPRFPLAISDLARAARSTLLGRVRLLWVARGAGEPTMQDVLGYWHGDLALSQVRGLGHAGTTRAGTALSIGRYQCTATVPNRLQTDTLPELDLLGVTFAHRGVAQLETSRGARTTARSALAGTRASGPARYRRRCRRSWRRCGRCSTATRRSRARCTWSMRSSSAVATTR